MRQRVKILRCREKEKNNRREREQRKYVRGERTDPKPQL